MTIDYEEYMDEADREWVKNFTTIPEGAIVSGFVSVISFINPDGSFGTRIYNCINGPTSHIVGLLNMAAFSYMHDAIVPPEDLEDK